MFGANTFGGSYYGEAFGALTPFVFYLFYIDLYIGQGTSFGDLYQTQNTTYTDLYNV